MSETKAAKTDAKAPEAETKAREIRLMPQRMQLREMACQDFVVVAEAGTLIEDVLKPEYWSHVALKIKPGDTIEVRVDTEEWILKLYVLETARSFIRVHALARYELGDWREVQMKTASHKIEWKGTYKKWTVIRIADSAEIKDGFADPAAANAFMVQHEKTAGK